MENDKFRGLQISSLFLLLIGNALVRSVESKWPRLSPALIVSRIFPPQGHMPSPSLLQKYDLMQFTDVTKAVRYANLPFPYLDKDLSFTASDLCLSSTIPLFDCYPNFSLFSPPFLWRLSQLLPLLSILSKVRETCCCWMRRWPNTKPSSSAAGSSSSSRSWK